MRISPKVPAVVYFLMGAVFLFAAYRSAVATNTTWNATTVILIIFTTLMFGASYRLIRLHFKLKKHNKKK